MNRAVLMSSGGNVFESLLVLKLFKKYWHDEVTKFYINFNNHAGTPWRVVSEFLSIASQDPKVHIIYHPEGIGNGPPITELLKICKEDYILLLEDDFFIFTPGKVDEFFKRIESGEVDLLGSPRYSFGEVADSAKVKYNLDYSGIGDRGFGWWPTGFFCKKEDLLKTDLDFGSKKYSKGEYFKELDHTFSEDCYTDTFTWASLQLRYLGLKSADIPQYHADPGEVLSKFKGEMNWTDGKPFWIHAGSLSSGWGGYLSGNIPEIQSETNRKEIETRVAFWTICSDEADGFDDFKKQYKQGIEDLIVGAKLDRGRITKKIIIYREMLGV